MKRIALKIDVDTLQGTRAGTPALAEALQRHGAAGTFFFSLGPDQTGREPGIGSLKSYYGGAARLYGTVFPAPDIGARCAEILRAIGAAGFETGVHAWNRVLWERRILGADNALVEAEIDKACRRFAEIFGIECAAHAAPGWRTNRHALRLTQRKGFAYASDCRGNHPFLPVVDGELVGCVQIPTTLPTLDELLALEPGFSAEQAMDRLVQLSVAIPGDHVVTLRAELEGMRFLAPFEALLRKWNDCGYRLVALRDISESLDVGELPRHNVAYEEIPGRAGVRMTQGGLFP